MADAQKELQETEYDQYISDTKQLLDDMYDDYEELLNKRLDDVDTLMENMIDTINQNSSDIGTTIRETSKDVGYTLTDEMNSIWSSSSKSSIITTYGNKFDSALTTVNEVLKEIAQDIKTVTGSRTTTKKTTTNTTKKTTNNNKKKSNTKTNSNPKTNNKNTNNKKKTTTKQGNGKGEIGDKVTYKSGIYHQDSAGGGRWGNQYLGKNVYITNTNPGSKYPYHISTGNKLGKGDLGWVKLNQLKGYKTGGLVDYTGLAQLDGTPNKPELVLNAQDTENFISLRDKLRDISEQSMNLWDNSYSGYSVPTVVPFSLQDFEKKIADLETHSQATNLTNEINVNIPIEHVQDYNEMLEQMKKDKKFENMVKAIGLTPLTGGSTLAKNHISWK